MRYFDHNATHPPSAAARAAWLDALDRFPANPSSPHRWGTRAGRALDEAREKLALWLGCQPHEVVWTSGATESNNAVLHHLGAVTDGRVLVSSVEHPSVQAAAERWLSGRCDAIPVDRSGVVDPGWIDERLRADRIAAVVVMAANNETGVLQPWREIQELCRRAGTLLVSDVAQWVGKLPGAGLGSADYVAGCAHKFGGMPGVGFLKGPPEFRPLLVGGPQEDGRRSGTENVPGVLSMVAALEERERGFETPTGSIAGRVVVRDRFVKSLKEGLPGVEIVGEGASRLWNTVAALMPAAADCRRRWVVRLDRQGWAVSTGSACASGKEKPSPVLAAMGYRPDESDRMLRFSAGWETTERDWEDLIEAIREAARGLLEGGGLPG
ncbi:MAG: cysteine desulfurase family protein [Limisphaerales bacterium]